MLQCTQALVAHLVARCRRLNSTAATGRASGQHEHTKTDDF